ncbi:MAG: hypothetical protein KAK04_18835, partial [Cyclobacteriaceae bacterium]|nr:hypothetical protein [Cyclobacteriaceae bacterium]
IGFLKKNPGFRIEIGAFIDQIYTDSIPSNDLTEVIADTVFFQIQKEELLSAGDSLDFESLNSEVDDISIDNDSLNDSKDSLAFLESNDSLTFLDSIEGLTSSDSMDIEMNEFELETELSPKDSILALGYALFEETETSEAYFKINYTYHNDRTQKQAEALMNKLIDSGVPANFMEAKGHGDEWIEDRAAEERNYWIELKIIKD